MKFAKFIILLVLIIDLVAFTQCVSPNLSHKKRLNTASESQSKFEKRIQKNLKPGGFYSSNLNIFFHTLNCGANLPSEQDIKYISESINKIKNKPDVFIFAFQEIVKINLEAALNIKPETRIEEWDKIISGIINSDSVQKEKSDYRKVNTLYLGATAGLIYVKRVKYSQFSFPNESENKKIKMGKLGILANKGAVFFAFNYYLSTVAIVIAHLEAGQNKSVKRIDELKQITDFKVNINDFSELYNSRYVSKTSLIDVREIDYLFVLGDLNFRVDLKYNEAIKIIENLNALKAKDQLLGNLASIGLKEEEIKFPPTYKFSVGKNEYTNKDDQAPSWCDRILYRTNEKLDKFLEVKNIEYISNPNVLFSDHKPVIGYFSIKGYQKGRHFSEEIKKTNKDQDERDRFFEMVQNSREQTEDDK